jgi:hypothetical protein
MEEFVCVIDNRASSRFPSMSAAILWLSKSGAAANAASIKIEAVEAAKEGKRK